SSGWDSGTNQALLMSKEMTRRGHKVTVICPARSVLGQLCAKEKIPVRNLKIISDVNMIASARLAGVLMKGRAEIVHAYHPKSHAVSLVSGYFNFLRPLLVVSRREMQPLSKDLISGAKYGSAGVSAYVTPCKSSAEVLLDAGVESARISVIPPAMEMMRWESANLIRPSMVMKRPYKIGMVARYTTGKEQEFFLRAVQVVAGRIPNSEFVIVGKGNEKMRGLARSLGISMKVHILGERRDVPEVMALMHIFVVPSMNDGITFPLIEAQASGVPCVGTQVKGVCDFMENDESGLLVKPGDHHALADAIVYLLQNPPDAMAMAHRAYVRVRACMSLDVVAGRLERLYKELIAMRKALSSFNANS
ncbi:MAG: glycosyltransferase family 4 protein, partial [Deltaproteobacteria bacterium]|nr:glycosyltransferase family 4 protein [Deltaproteobacteria bacterium]